MCGIYCCISDHLVGQTVLEGLQRLEYRGYDSAGLAWLADGELKTYKTVGRVQKLVNELRSSNIESNFMLGHTRWATHGTCTTENAHPHTSNGRLAIVHNGIIENYLELQVELQQAGYKFDSTTDSEVLAHLLHRELNKLQDPVEAIRAILHRMEGNYAFVVCFREHPDRIFGVCNGSPLVVGLGDGTLLLSSDMTALIPVTSKLVYLENGTIFSGNWREFHCVDFDGKECASPVVETPMSERILDLGSYHTHTEKEIFEQPTAVIETIRGRLTDSGIIPDIAGAGSDELLKQVDEIQIVGCGSSYHAGLVAQHWFETIAGMPCRVEIASEFNARTHVKRGKCLIIAISQSGETADTITALRLAKKSGYFASLCICNVESSALMRLCDYCLLTRAGPEIGVATTKALTTQMVCLLMLVVRTAQLRSDEEVPEVKEAMAGLLELSNHISRALLLNNEIIKLCPEVSSKHNVMFLGKGVHFPVAMEGSLKLKELSYIHAEAYPAGELKHGPLALVDYRMSVIAVAPNNDLLSKLQNNLNEVRARHGRLIVFADQEIDFSARHEKEIIISVFAPNRLTSPIVHTIPLQLLSYYVATNLGVDIDKPRNLAKSVTVE